MSTLLEYHVTYIERETEASLVFVCHAENEDHAREQAGDEATVGRIVSVTLSAVATRIHEAARRGTKAGEARASWVFDGNTDTETYRKVLEGIEEGDTAILDNLDWSPLSGEHAGESIPELLGDLLPPAPERFSRDAVAAGEICEAYELAATSAYWDTIAATARYHLED